MVRLLPRIFFSGCSACSSCSAPARAKRIAPAATSEESSGAGYRFDRGGWKYVHLEGTPEEIGFSTGSCSLPKLPTWSMS